MISHIVEETPPRVVDSVYLLLSSRVATDARAGAIEAPGRKPLSYGDLLGLITRTGERLNALGIGRNDRVAIVLPNGPEMATAFLAVASHATSAPLNPAYQEAEFSFYLTDLKAKALIVLAGETSPATETASALGIPILQLQPLYDEAAGLFELEGEPIGENTGTGTAEADDVALILHTSGTTSRPKIVPLTHRNLCASAHNIARTLHLGPEDRCLNVMPLFHIHGLMAAVLASVAAGGRVCCTPGFYAPQFFDWMMACRPTWYTAVPTMHQAILSRAGDNRRVIEENPLRFIRSSSSSLAPQVLEALEQTFGAPVVEAYGMTEAAHQMASNPLPPLKRKPGTVGLAAGPEVAIMDEAGNLLPPGRTGEIVIRGANVMGGYENNPEANARAFTDGWFRTGDQGSFDEDGYLTITGRLKEIINRGGEKISPREVDEVLLDHPAVAQAVVFAVPDPALGEDVAAAVVLHPERTVTERQLREFAAARLAAFKVPRQILFLQEIPKGPTGKIQRIGLAERLGVGVRAEPETPSEREPSTEPVSAVEKVLAALWIEILGLDGVGVNDHFLDVGGDSMLATRLLSRIRQEFDLELSVLDFFDAPTIAEQATLIETRLVRTEESLP